MLWNIVKPNSKTLYFFGCMTVAYAQLAVAVDTVNDPDCPGLGDSTNLETSHRSFKSREIPLHV